MSFPTSSGGAASGGPRPEGGWHLADSLRSELMSIAGIASAELDGGEDAPQGVRVQLAAGADAESVGREVQRVLANHGMRSHRAKEQPAVDSPPAAHAATARVVASDFQPPGPPPPPGAASGGGAVFHLPGATSVEVEEPRRELEPIQVIEEEEPAAAPMVLDSVSVEESRDGIAVRVVAGDNSVTRQVGNSADGMDAAIVGALTELLGLEVGLMSVQRGEVGDAMIVTVLVEVVGVGRQVGSAVVTAGETFAVGLAAWRALTAQE